jgi:hypothetical protein
MMPYMKIRIPLSIPAFLIAATLTACDSSSNPMAPDAGDFGPALPTVVVGQVSAPAQGSAGSAGQLSGRDLSGVLVTIDGTQAADTTDSAGTFRVEAVSSDRKMVLRFRRGSLDARIEIEGVNPGALLRLEITLHDDSVSLSDSSQGDHNEFEGKASFVSVSGFAPARILRVEIADTAGALLVDIVEGSTRFDNEGDILSFGDVLAALAVGGTPEMEGDGTRQDDGSVAAAEIKVETDEDAENEFEGKASFVSVSGIAPARALRVEVADTTGTLLVDIIEGFTRFDNEGDFLSFGDVFAALQAGTALRVEGEGTLRADGTIGAVEAKVETDD